LFSEKGSTSGSPRAPTPTSWSAFGEVFFANYNIFLKSKIMKN
jgi:hypothetical protein